MLKSFMIKLPLCLLALLLCSCAKTGSASNACDVFSPIYIDRGDVLTDGTSRQLLNHDLTGAKLCGWAK